MLYVNTKTFTFSKSYLSYRQAERTRTSFSCELLLTNALGGASKTLKASMLRLSCICMWQCFFKETASGSIFLMSDVKDLAQLTTQSGRLQCGGRLSYSLDEVLRYYQL